MAKPWAKPFYNSKEWKQLRKYILMRDRYICVKCGQPAEEVHHVVHLTPDNITDMSVSMSPDNLLSLCKDCHFKEHVGERIEARNAGNIKVDGLETYEFDENGYLVLKNSPL